MNLKCRKWQIFARNHFVLLHFLCIFSGLFPFIVMMDQSLANNANRTAEIKAKLLKIIQKGKCIRNLIFYKSIYNCVAKLFFFSTNF